MQIPSKPRASNYPTNDGMHAAMRQWAKQMARPSLKVEAQWPDSPEVYVDTYSPATREQEYRTPDGGTYTQTVDTHKYDCHLADEPITQTELKRQVTAWLSDGLELAELVSLKWSKET